ncbi:MAG: HD domain-containing protein [Wujia sp.]
MNRVDKIINHALYKKYMAEIKKAEIDRVFCLHDINHSLDVARICYILNLEEKLDFDKELIYAMALLHDIGRVEEYVKGVSHHTAGAEISEEILRACGFENGETQIICQAISNHKSASEDIDRRSLGFLLYRADKLSRNCFDCSAYEQCYWSENLKNKGIVV